MSAVASKYISKAEIDLPMHRLGLRNLHQKLDALCLEVKCSAFQCELPEVTCDGVVPRFELDDTAVEDAAVSRVKARRQ